MLDPKIDLYIVAIPPPRDHDGRGDDFMSNPLGANSTICNPLTATVLQLVDGSYMSTWLI